MDDPKTVRFRGAEPRDMPRLVALIGALFAIETAFTADPARQEKGLRALLASPSAHILAAEADNEVVGMCTVQLTVSTAVGGPSGVTGPGFERRRERRTRASKRAGLHVGDLSREPRWAGRPTPPIGACRRLVARRGTQAIPAGDAAARNALVR